MRLNLLRRPGALRQRRRATSSETSQRVSRGAEPPGADRIGRRCAVKPASGQTSSKHGLLSRSFESRFDRTAAKTVERRHRTAVSEELEHLPAASRGDRPTSSRRRAPRAAGRRMSARPGHRGPRVGSTSDALARHRRDEHLAHASNGRSPSGSTGSHALLRSPGAVSELIARRQHVQVREGCAACDAGCGFRRSRRSRSSPSNAVSRPSSRTAACGRCGWSRHFGQVAGDPRDRPRPRAGAPDGRHGGTVPAARHAGRGDRQLPDRDRGARAKASGAAVHDVSLTRAGLRRAGLGDPAGLRSADGPSSHRYGQQHDPVVIEVNLVAGRAPAMDELSENEWATGVQPDPPGRLQSALCRLRRRGHAPAANVVAEGLPATRRRRRKARPRPSRASTDC